MPVFSGLLGLIKKIFSAKKNDSPHRRELKKCDYELRQLRPAVYKNGFILPIVGEAFHILFVQSKKIDQILSAALFSEDIQLNARYADMLIFTGFSGEDRQLLNSLEYTARKKETAEGDQSKILEDQRRRLDSLIKKMESEEFQHIETVLQRLERLSDICRFSYVTAIHLFDKDFSVENDTRTPIFNEIPAADIENVFMDFYFLTADFEIDTAIARSVTVLAEQLMGGFISENEAADIICRLKKASAILRRVLTPSFMQQTLVYIKKDPEFIPQKALYDSRYTGRCIERLRKRFDGDSSRIRTELQDERLSAAVKQLFGARELIISQGYNGEINDLLIQNGAPPFLWITPLQIVKSFIMYFFDDNVLSLLNDIVVEGFFFSPVFKTDFASAVFTAAESRARLQTFEAMFSKGNELDQALITSYVRDGHQNSDLMKKLVQIIETANAHARGLIENEVNIFEDLYEKIVMMDVDSKKSSPSYVSNIKILFTSTRNRENVDILEKQFLQWDKFLEIMRNYVIMRVTEKKS